MSADEGKYYSSIGGWLWLPAIGTVLNILMSAYAITINASVGASLLVIYLVVAYLFWARKRVFPYVYVLSLIAVTAVTVRVADPQDIGRNLVAPIFFAICFFVTARARRTFIEPLKK